LIYGGDHCDPANPDLAVMAKHIQETYRVPLCGVQCDILLDWGAKVNSHVEYVYYYPTDYFIKPDNGKRGNYWAGVTKKENKQCDKDGNIIESPLPEGTPVGQTKVYLSERVRYLLQSRFGEKELQKGGVIAIGGGGGSKEEIQFAYEHNVPVAYVQCEGRVPDTSLPGGVYGPCDAYVESLGYTTSNTATDGLYDGLWMIKGDGDVVTSKPVVRDTVSIPVLQCIFPSTSTTVDCEVFVPDEDDPKKDQKPNGKYDFSNVWQYVHKIVKVRM